jgi:hypothetical protein
MNDNLRYVSLQYIKGDNYEDVDSFKVPDIRGVLNTLKNADLLDNPEKVKELYDGLEETLEKKKIGESFLEDLINYSSLKLIKKDLDEAKKTAEKKIKELKEESKKIGNGNEKKGEFLNARSKIAGLLLDVIEVLDMVKRGDISEPPVDDAAETPDTTILPKKAKMFLKRVKEYLSNVETTKGKIDKIEEKITKLENNTNKISSNVRSNFEKLKEDAIKKVEKLNNENFEDTIKIPAEGLLQELQAIISDGKLPINKIETNNAASKFKLVDKAITTAYETAVAKPVTDAAKAAELAKAEKAKVLFDIVKSSIDKLNNLVNTTNVNIAKLTELKDKVKDAIAKATDAKAKATDAKAKATEAIEKAKELNTANIQNKEAYQAIQADADKAKEVLFNKFEELKTLLEKAYKLLEELHKNVIKQSDALEKDKKDYLKSLDSLVALYSSYINICKKNILKYDKLFEHNEISNIDEAFMIKSYSDFLKKLNKLKKNLETKDINKIRRALTDSINRLFNMYGVNTNNEAFMKALFEGYKQDGTEENKGTEGNDDKKTKDIDYIIDRIINYNLAK